MTDNIKKEKYWCCNYACQSNKFCKRFIKDDQPLKPFEFGGEKNIDENNRHFLQPFINGENGKMFYPLKDGMCNYFIEIEGSTRLDGYV